MEATDVNMNNNYIDNTSNDDIEDTSRTFLVARH